MGWTIQKLVPVILGVLQSLGNFDIPSIYNQDFSEHENKEFTMLVMNKLKDVRRQGGQQAEEWGLGFISNQQILVGSKFQKIICYYDIPR